MIDIRKKKPKPKTKLRSKTKPKPKQIKKSNKAKKVKKEYKLFTNPPEPVTWQSLMNWLADTGWVEGHIGRKISPLDRPYFDDYVQEVWLQILSVPHEKMLEIWHRGKGKAIEYIKAIIMNNIYSNSSHLYKNIRFANTIEKTLTDEQWKRLDDDGESEFDISFCINDFELGNRALHRGIDSERCKVLTEDDRMGEDNIEI